MICLSLTTKKQCEEDLANRISQVESYKRLQADLIAERDELQAEVNKYKPKGTTYKISILEGSFPHLGWNDMQNRAVKLVNAGAIIHIDWE